VVVVTTEFKFVVVLFKELRTANGVSKVSSSRPLVEGSWVQDGMGF
jgi:hypothetical protein